MSTDNEEHFLRKISVMQGPVSLTKARHFPFQILERQDILIMIEDYDVGRYSNKWAEGKHGKVCVLEDRANKIQRSIDEPCKMAAGRKFGQNILKLLCI